jgi:hypothetical protein
MTLIDGIVESRDTLWGSAAGFWRKIGGTSSYDGLPELIARTYRTLELRQPQPISLDEIDDAARLVDCFTRMDPRL